MPARLHPADVGQDAVSFMYAVESWRARPACWLLAALFAVLFVVLVSQAAAPPAAPAKSAEAKGREYSVKIAPREPAPETNALSFPALPKPASARRADLPSAFTGKAPASVIDLRSMERHVEGLAARLSPAVVAVEIGSGSGSGVVV